MNSDASRRSFLGAAVATGVMSIVPRRVLGGEGFVPPSRQITLAHIGMGTQGFERSGPCWAIPRSRSSPSATRTRTANDYIEWGKIRASATRFVR